MINIKAVNREGNEWTGSKDNWVCKCARTHSGNEKNCKVCGDTKQ